MAWVLFILSTLKRCDRLFSHKKLSKYYSVGVSRLDIYPAGKSRGFSKFRPLNNFSLEYQESRLISKLNCNINSWRWSRVKILYLLLPMVPRMEVKVTMCMKNYLRLCQDHFSENWRISNNRLQKFTRKKFVKVLNYNNIDARSLYYEVLI